MAGWGAGRHCAGRSRLEPVTDLLAIEPVPDVEELRAGVPGGELLALEEAAGGEVERAIVGVLSGDAEDLLAGDDGVLMRAEYVLHPSGEPGEPPGVIRGLAVERVGDGLGGITRALGTDPDGVEVLGRIVRAEGAAAGLERLPRPGHQGRQRRAAGLPGVVPERGMHGGLGQAGQQAPVALALEHRPERLRRPRVPSVEGREKRPECIGQLARRLPEPVFHDVDVAHVAQPPGQPLEFGFDRLGPIGIHQAAEHAEHAPEPPHRRPEPMHALDIPQSGRGIVDPDPSQADLQRRPDGDGRRRTGAILGGVSSASGTPEAIGRSGRNSIEWGTSSCVIVRNGKGMGPGVLPPKPDASITIAESDHGFKGGCNDSLTKRSKEIDGLKDAMAFA